MQIPPIVEPGPPLTPEQAARASRHVLLPGIGLDGQRRLRAARVCVVGAGGLGAPVLQYLAAAGVGSLTVVDDDVVDVSNLQRQVVHGTSDVGRAKVDSARDAVVELDPSVRVVTHRVRLTSENADDILSGHDVVVDGTDNFPTRYLVSDACERLGVPVVWGSVLRFDAQASVFWGRPPEGVPAVTLRDLFPSPPPPDEVPSCAVAGVIGALCGQIGSVMATEVVKLVTGAGEPLLGRVLVVDAARARWTTLPLGRAADRRDRPLSARSTPGEVDLGGKGLSRDISVDELDARLAAGDVVLVDVREPGEAAAASIPGAELIPLARVLDGTGTAHLPRDREVVVHCTVGGRSAVAVQVLRAAGIDAVNLTGGIQAWLARP